MKKVITQIGSMILPFVMLFVFLYNPVADGTAIGMNLYPLSPLAVSIANLLGNVVWILGVIFVGGAIMLGVATYVIDTEVGHDRIYPAIDREMNRRLDEERFLITSRDLQTEGGDPIVPFGNPFFRWIMRPIVIVVAFIGVATGFWFTGSAWLLIILMHRVFQGAAHKECTKLIAERVTETAPQRAVRVAKTRMSEVINGTVQRMHDDPGFRQEVEDEILGEK